MQVTVTVDVLSFGEAEIRFSVPNTIGVAATMQAFTVSDVTAIVVVEVEANAGPDKQADIKIAVAEKKR